MRDVSFEPEMGCFRWTLRHHIIVMKIGSEGELHVGEMVVERCLSRRLVQK
jgi:hypothetical protein